MFEDVLDLPFSWGKVFEVVHIYPNFEESFDVVPTQSIQNSGGLYEVVPQ